MTNLTWTKHEREDYKRPNEKAARIMALYLMQQSGNLNIERKGEFAKRIGVSRHTLDRDLTTLEAAKELAAEYIKKIQE
jgi:hypothetical protein